VSEQSIDYKMGQLEARMAEVEKDLSLIKESTTDISNALTKGKGVFIGLIIAASSAGVVANKLIAKFME
jgi:hypothetical protein